jgi:hypothetical protein
MAAKPFGRLDLKSQAFKKRRKKEKFNLNKEEKKNEEVIVGIDFVYYVGSCSKHIICMSDIWFSKDIKLFR